MRPEPPTLSVDARRILLDQVWDLLFRPLPLSDDDGNESSPSLESAADEGTPGEND
jgi:hypothetical protein